MRLRRKLAAGSAVVGVAALAGIAGVVSAGGKPLSTDLTGVEEVPGPGDFNATGVAQLEFNQGKGEVCFDLSWAQVDGTVAAAHIHVGPPGVAGPVVVPLFSGAFDGTDETSGCVSNVSTELIKAIRQHPAEYYVNVHSTTYPAGAVRGQLGD